MGATLKNTNSLKNGSRVNRLVLGTLPKKLWRVQRTVRAYRQHLEDETQSVHGSVGTVMAHHVDCAVMHQQHRQIAA